MGLRYGATLYDHGFRMEPQSIERLNLGKECEREIKRVFPEILEEIHGFADACHARYEHLASFILSIGAFEPTSTCSVFAASSGSDVLFGRNYDFYYRFKEHAESYLTMPKDGYWSLGNTDIFVGREDGVNEMGLAVGMAAVRPRQVKPGISFALAVRSVLDRCATVKEGVKALIGMHFLVTNNYFLADKEGDIAVVEASSVEFE
jgi:predicted choloylglycine hydrolase